MKLIPVGDKFAKVDDGDYASLVARRWYLQIHKGMTYARIWDTMMHRQIMGLGPRSTQHVDHIDGDGLNNQRSNLRIATQMANTWNRKKHSHRAGRPVSSIYKGVRERRPGRWSAEITVNYKPLYLGYFHSELDAAHAYDAAALTHFGEFARLNFPKAGGASCLV